MSHQMLAFIDRHLVIKEGFGLMENPWARMARKIVGFFGFPMTT